MQDVIALIQSKPEGIKAKDLIDAYVGVEKDFQTLRQHAQVYVMYANTPKEVFFHIGNPLDCFVMESKFCECWQTTPLPGMDVSFLVCFDSIFFFFVNTPYFIFFVCVVAVVCVCDISCKGYTQHSARKIRVLIIRFYDSSFTTQGI